MSASLIINPFGGDGRHLDFARLHWILAGVNQQQWLPRVRDQVDVIRPDLSLHSYDLRQAAQHDKGNHNRQAVGRMGGSGS